MYTDTEQDQFHLVQDLKSKSVCPRTIIWVELVGCEGCLSVEREGDIGRFCRVEHTQVQLEAR